MDPTVQTNPIIVGYSPNDFFYYSVAKSEVINACATTNGVKDSDCTMNLQTGDRNFSNCYNYELCKNKGFSDWFMKTQTSHSGADERFQNTQSIYNTSVQTMSNLCIGIFGVGIFIYYNK